MPPKASSPLSALLTDSLARCKAIEAKLSTPASASPPSQPPIEPLAPLADARNDFVALCQLLGKHSTELSLAMKPPVSLQAAEQTVAKVQAVLGKLTFCLEQLPADGALTQEIHWTALEVIEALTALLAGSLALHQLPVSSASLKPAKAQREINLRLTGQVWDAVKRCESLSADELAASRKGWQTVLGLLDDCLEEVKELEESEAPGEEDEDGDDSDDEDEFRSSHPLSDEERTRVAAAHTVLRLGRLLIFRLLTSTKPDTELAPAWKQAALLAKLRKLTRELSAGADDLAGTLEPPQEEEDLKGMAGEFAKVARELSQVVGDMKEEAKARAEVETQTEGGAKGAKSEAEWQATWREQLQTAEDKLLGLC